MPLYLISVTPGIDPVLYERQSQGFIEASSKAKAIAQASLSVSYPYSRLEARTKSEVGERVWEIEQEMFPKLPRFCEYTGCKNQLGKSNQSGYCQQHTEYAPHRKNRKPAKYRSLDVD